MATMVSTMPTITWTALTGNAGYRILVATSSSALPMDPTVGACASCVINTVTATSLISYKTSAALKSLTKYHWEVQALTPAAGFGTWSSVYTFTTSL
jgi:hypothetical protein